MTQRRTRSSSRREPKHCLKCGIKLGSGDVHDVALHDEAQFLRCVGRASYLKSLATRKPRKPLTREQVEALTVKP